MDLLTELRRRLDVPTTVLSDEVLDHMLDVATSCIDPWLVDDPTPYAANVDEATVQLAVKIVDASPRGIVDALGDLYTPPWAHIRAVFPVLGPALATGGLSV